VDIFNGKKGDRGVSTFWTGSSLNRYGDSHTGVSQMKRLITAGFLTSIPRRDPDRRAGRLQGNPQIDIQAYCRKKDHRVAGRHPDGLYNPSHYFEKLQRECFSRLVSSKAPEDDAHHEPSDFGPEVLRQYQGLMSSYPQYRPFYIIGEKILTRSEKMPEDWAIFGTTGYAFLNSLNGIFVDTKNAKIFDASMQSPRGLKIIFPTWCMKRRSL